MQLCSHQGGHHVPSPARLTRQRHRRRCRLLLPALRRHAGQAPPRLCQLRHHGAAAQPPLFSFPPPPPPPPPPRPPPAFPPPPHRAPPVKPFLEGGGGRGPPPPRPPRCGGKNPRPGPGRPLSVGHRRSRDRCAE